MNTQLNTQLKTPLLRGNGFRAARSVGTMKAVFFLLKNFFIQIHSPIRVEFSTGYSSEYPTGIQLVFNWYSTGTDDMCTRARGEAPGTCALRPLQGGRRGPGKEKNKEKTMNFIRIYYPWRRLAPARGNHTRNRPPHQTPEAATHPKNTCQLEKHDAMITRYLYNRIIAR